MDVWQGALHFLDAGESWREGKLHHSQGLHRPLGAMVMHLVDCLRQQQAVHQILHFALSISDVLPISTITPEEGCICEGNQMGWKSCLQAEGTSSTLPFPKIKPTTKGCRCRLGFFKNQLSSRKLLEQISL